MNTDDAVWLLYAFRPEENPIANWASSQGRLWAYVAGPQFLLALRFQDTWIGELLRYGSFLLFVALFYALIWKLFSRGLALVAAALFIATVAVRFEGSVLINYPMYTWTAGSAFMAAALAAIYYSRRGHAGALVATGILLFFSYFTQEGLAALFIGLFPLLLILETSAGLPSIRGIMEGLWRPRRRLLLLTWATTLALYASVAGGWALTHPSTYPGHSLAPIDISNIATALISFSTAASFISDLFVPYVVRYGDVMTGSLVSITYDPWALGSRVLTDTTAIISAVLCGGVIYGVLAGLRSSSPRRGGMSTAGISSSRLSGDEEVVARTTGRRGDTPVSKGSTGLGAGLLAGACLVGLAIAFVPQAPVAMTERYQSYHLELGIRAHTHSIVAQFGWSLVVAAAVFALTGALLRRLSTQSYTAAIAALAVLVGISAAASSRMNDDILADIRPEGLRWQVLERAIVNAQAFEPPLRSVWAPRFGNGTWFTKVPEEYWGRYGSSRYQSTLGVTTGELEASQVAAGNAALLDYFPSEDGRAATIVLARLEPVGSSVRANAVLVDAKAATSSYIASTFLSYRDASGRIKAVRLEAMDAVGADDNLRYIDHLQADPSSITLTQSPKVTAFADICFTGIGVGSKVNFGRSPAQADAGECRLRTSTTGWYPPEPGGVWSQGPKSELTIPGYQWPSGPIALTFHLSTYIGMGFQEGSQTVAISVNGRQLSSLTITGVEDPMVHLIVPPDLRGAEDRLVVTFDVSDPIVPAEVRPASLDTRSLGVYLKALSTSMP